MSCTGDEADDDCNLVLHHISSGIFSGVYFQLGPNGLRGLNFISSSSDNYDDVVQKVLDMGGILEGNVMMMTGGQTMAIPDTAQADTGMLQVLVRWGMLPSFLVEQLPEDVVGMLEKILQDISSSDDNSQHVSMIDSSRNANYVMHHLIH